MPSIGIGGGVILYTTTDEFPLGLTMTGRPCIVMVLGLLWVCVFIWSNAFTYVRGVVSAAVAVSSAASAAIVSGWSGCGRSSCSSCGWCGSSSSGR